MFKVIHEQEKAMLRIRYSVKIGFSVIIVLLILVILQYDIRYRHWTAMVNSIGNNEKNITTDPPEIIYSLACKVPQLDPFDQSIKEYTDEKTEPPQCHEKYPLVYKMGLNFTLIRNENTEEWKNCCYRIISRPTGKDRKIDYKVMISEVCTPMLGDVTEIPRHIEFIGVVCEVPETQMEALESNETLQLIDGFAFVPKKNLARKYNSMRDKKDNSSTSKEFVNLVVFGIDGVSRMNFLRTIPRVHNYLLDYLGAISMEGQVVVGENTFPNFLAALMNRTIEESEEECEEDNSFDKCPLIFKEFAAKGYVTSFTEDGPKIAAFNYGKNGFIRPPTDYYFRPLSIVFNSIYSDLRGESEVCYGPRLAFEILLNYMQKFAISMKEQNRRYFHFTWASTLTHGLLNTAVLGEAALLETLQWFRTEGFFNRTVFVLMSDHGYKRGGVSEETRQGKIEKNLPFLYFLFPEWFKEKYSLAVKNVIGNSEKLTSPFDLYATFLDILELESIRNEKILERQESILQSERITRGISMFLPIPGHRGCEMAGITEHFCVCQNNVELNVNSSVVIQAADYTVSHLNSLVSLYPNCSYLSLKNITKAYKILDEENDRKNDEDLLKVSFVTVPGFGEFETTVAIKNQTKRSWSIIGISRVNLYKNQSHCVDDKLMKNYCYCVDLLAYFNN